VNVHDGTIVVVAFDDAEFFALLLMAQTVGVNRAQAFRLQTLNGRVFARGVLSNEREREKNENPGERAFHA
jgi:hypothetical protein